MRRAVLPLIVLLFAAAGCGDGGKASKSDRSAAAPTPTRTQPSPSQGGCGQVGRPPQKQDGGQKKPRKPLAGGKTYTLTVKTNCGDFSFRLDLKSAPKASASMVSLTKAGFFNGTVFHRIVPGFVIQGGDPTATGSGGPGYKTVDRPPRDAAYTHGVVAMEKAGNEAAGTAGSQFFVVTGQDAQLPPDYAVVGKVTKGLDSVDRIGRLGDPATEQPTQTVLIESVKVHAS